MSAANNGNRQYDMVVLGATGYTGKLTAEYITTHLRTDLKWAVAGRTESKLQAVVDECKRLNPDRAPPAIEIANLNDSELLALAQKTRALVTTIGPYAIYGEHAFKACAEAGTHYVDVTGEVAWVAKMIKKYEATAKKTGAIMIPQAGLESTPPDLTTWLLAKTIRTELGAKTKDVVISVHTFSSTPSGGSINTALSLFDVFSLKEVADANRPYALSPVPHPEPARPSSNIFQKIFGVRSVPNLGMQTTSFLASTDRSTVERTWGLLSEIPSRKEEFYGPRFTWAEYHKARNWLHGIVLHWALIVGFLVLTSSSQIRNLIRKFVFQPGQGSEKEETERQEIEYRGIAYPDSEKTTGKIASSRTWYHGGTYYLTGILLVEAAATILEDDVQLPGGVYTPACLGQGLVDRLQMSGVKFEVKIIDA